MQFLDQTSTLTLILHAHSFRVLSGSQVKTLARKIRHEEVNLSSSVTSTSNVQIMNPSFDEDDEILMRALSCNFQENMANSRR